MVPPSTSMAASGALARVRPRTTPLQPRPNGLMVSSWLRDRCFQGGVCALRQEGPPIDHSPDAVSFWHIDTTTAAARPAAHAAVRPRPPVPSLQHRLPACLPTDASPTSSATAPASTPTSTAHPRGTPKPAPPPRTMQASATHPATSSTPFSPPRTIPRATPVCKHEFGYQRTRFLWLRQPFDRRAGRGSEHRRSQREEAVRGRGERSTTGSRVVPKLVRTVVPIHVPTDKHPQPLNAAVLPASGRQP